jgi:translation elongation factor EF-4
MSSKYGGDKTRQRKLLEQQREGKKKLKSQANIKLSKTVLINVLKKE